MKLGIAESFMCSPARHQAEVGGFPRLRLCLFIFKHSSADATDFHNFSSSLGRGFPPTEANSFFEFFRGCRQLDFIVKVVKESYQ